MSEPIEQRIQNALEKVRPYLQEDGGDVEMIRMREDGILEVSLTGTCKRCPMSLMTLRAGVERAVMNEVPEVKRVETV
jgi:Fe-S cluster biogenesis protein NfuA